MLRKQLDQLNLADVLQAPEDFKPFAGYRDRTSWEGIHPDILSYYLRCAEQHLRCSWPQLPATAYMDFHRTGNRSRYEAVTFGRNRMVKQLLLAECLEGKGRFLDDLLNGVWSICEESTWVIPAHNNYLQGREYRILPDVEEEVVLIDLFAAETASLLTWVVYFLQESLDAVSPLICRRIRYEVNRRIMEPFLRWNHMRWMGYHGGPVNNWNPWILSNVLSAFLVLEKDVNRRIQGVTKSLETLENYINGYAPDGGCNEGPHYWNAAGASLFDCLELVHEATGGKFSVYGEELIQNIGRYIQRAHIAGPYYVNFADGGTRANASYDLVRRYGRRIGDSGLEEFGSAMLAMNGYTDMNSWMLYREIRLILNDQAEEMQGAGKEPPTAGDVWLDGLEFMVAREDPHSAKGFCLAAKGGHNAESHNHNDIGSFVVFYNGLPILIDPGVETYTADTFHAVRRYDIWTMQSSFHNLPEINGWMQKDGREYKANDVQYEAADHEVKLSMDLAGAYPVEAGIERWVRTIQLNRHNDAEIIVVDDYKLKEATHPIVLNVITSQEPDLQVPGEILLKGEDGSEVILSYNEGLFHLEVQSIELTDPKIHKDWMRDRIYRLRLRTVMVSTEGRLSIRLGVRK